MNRVNMTIEQSKSCKRMRLHRGVLVILELPKLQRELGFGQHQVHFDVQSAELLAGATKLLAGATKDSEHTMNMTCVDMTEAVDMANADGGHRQPLKLRRELGFVAHDL